MCVIFFFFGFFCLDLQVCGVGAARAEYLGSGEGGFFNPFFNFFWCMLCGFSAVV